MKKKIKLTESDLENIIKRVLNEQSPKILRGLLCPIACKTKVLGKGNTGEDVKLIQNALAKCGFNKEKFGGGMKVGCDKDHTKCDGKFNTETVKAVKEFQKSVFDNPKEWDGRVGSKTLVKLMDKCLSPVDCLCKKKNPIKSPQPIKNKPGVDLSDKVTVGCKKSIECFKKNKDDACGLANCLGVCIPEGMCKGRLGCKGCPKSFNEMPGPGVPNKRTDKIQRCIDSECTTVVS